MKIIVPNTSSSFFQKLNFNHSCKDEDVVDNKTNESMKESPSSAPVSPNTSFITTPTISNNPSMSSTDLNHEENRLKTFDASWPHSYIRPRILAKIGFYYLRPNGPNEPDDRVKCNFCKVEVQQWEPNDNEIGEHLKHSPNCPLLRRNETPNVPIDAAELDQLLPPVSYDVCGTYAIDRRPDAYPETPFPASPSVDIVENTSNIPHTTNSTVERETQTLRHPDYPEYAIETARLRSFDEWPKTMKQTPQQLSDAGFFYTRVGDRVICFSCGGGLRGWEEDDEPWEQHALWYGKCDYLRLVKGSEYVESVKAKVLAQNENQNNGSLSSSSQESVASSCSSASSSHTSSSSASSTPINSQTCGGEKDEQNPDKKICESRLCKICYSSEYNTAFFPCGHVIACAKCASSVTKCPMCRKPFERLMRVYFS